MPSASARARSLDNLIFVVNCNLQRLDGPVRGNKRIIDELEGVFRGAGWNVIKVIWGSDWDALFDRDHTGLLLKRMEECVDGDFQAYKAKGGAYLREDFFGKYPELLELVKDKTDEQLGTLHRGGHDPLKIYNAYKRATEHKGGPTVILAKTVKGYGLRLAAGRNATHSEKKLTDDGLAAFVKRFDIPLPEQAAKDGAFYRPEPTAPELAVHAGATQDLGGYLPQRDGRSPPALQGTRPRLLQGVDWRLQGPRGLHHHGLRRHPARADEGPKHRQADRAHRARRRPHLRLRIRHQAGRHLRARRPEVHAARRRHAARLPRRKGRPDPGRRHHGSRLHGQLHRRRHGLRQLRRAHDSLLHVLLHVRLSSASATWPGPSPTRAARAS